MVSSRDCLAETVAVWGRRREAVDEICVSEWGLGEGCEASTDLAVVVRGADLVVLATPVGVMRELSERVVEVLEGDENADRVVIDIASVKGRVVEDVAPVFEGAGISFVPCHPMAGAEKAGWEYARADLFSGSVCVVTPQAGVGEAVVGRVGSYWDALGARVVRMDARDHDRVVARVSHLPHAAAAVLVQVALAGGGGEVAGNGLRDSTRVASGPAEMWAEILLENGEAVMESIEAFRDGMGELLAFLEKKDEEGLRRFLSRSKEMRDGLGGGGN